MRHLILAAALLTLPAAHLSAQDAARGERGTAPRRVEAPLPVNDQPASETRNELEQMLTQQYPPMLAQVLRLDPTLLMNQEFLASYPMLQAFIARHPEVARNPSYFLGGVASFNNGRFLYDPPGRRSQVAEAMKDMFGGMLFLIGFSLVVITLATGLKSVIEHRRWLRLSKIQTDAHSKLLDRLTSNDDLLAYMQSAAGRQFLEATPLPLAATPKASISAPVNRILWSVQAGIVLALGGAGLWYSRSFVVEEMTQPLAVMGLLTIFLGIGFVLSSFVAYGLSKMLGLFDTPGMRTNA
jgi:hypothetical protein